MARQLFLPALSFRRISAPNVVYSHRSRYKPTRRGEQLVKRVLNEIVSKMFKLFIVCLEMCCFLNLIENSSRGLKGLYICYFWHP